MNFILLIYFNIFYINIFLDYGGIRFVNFLGEINVISGWVEIFYNYIWGLICDDLFDLWDVKVVCCMLGWFVM